MAWIGTVALIGWGSVASAEDVGSAGEAAKRAEVAADAPDGQPQAQAERAEPGKRRLDGVEEIVVTARKREENLQDTPISVSAFNAADLQEKSAGRIDDIGKFTPNLQLDSGGGQASARISIRGVGNGDAIETRDPGVGIYLDGVYLARAQGQLLGLADIERVEVLRGPQGTLFGRNTIGGAVSITSQKPSDEFGGTLQVRTGNYNLFESRGTVNVPLMPEVAALRVSFQTATREGYTENRMFKEDTDDRRLLAGRFALRVNPGDSVELMLTGEQTRSHTAGRGGECRFNPNAVNMAPLFQPRQVVIGGTPLTIVPAQVLGFAQACIESQADGEELKYTSPIKSNQDLDTYGLASTLTWDLDEITFKSISAWRRQEQSANTDVTFARVNVGNVVTPEQGQQDQVSQEFNLNGTSFNGRLKWATGLYGLYEKTTPVTTTTFVSFQLCRINASACDSSFNQRQRIRTLATAAYGQFTYDLTERLSFTGGLRRSLEGKFYKQDQQRFTTPTTLGPFFSTSQTERFDAWTPLANLSYKLGDDAMVYATYSKGFKSGGFNGRPSPRVGSTLEPFDQEELDNYEVGVKSSFFDRRLVANVALFYGKYNDIQQTVLTSDPVTTAFASRVINAAKADIRGAEVELRAVPLTGLELAAGLGFTDAEYDKFDDMVQVFDPTNPNADPMTGVVALPVDRSKEDFFNTPNFNATLSASYTLYDLPMGDLTARLNWFHQNPINYGPNSNADTVRQGTYGLLSGRLGLKLPDGKTEIAFFAENILNRRYLNSGTSFEDGFAASLAYFGPPRMYGIELRRDF